VMEVAIRRAIAAEVRRLRFAALILMVQIIIEGR
jgi:hypothetical protein